MSLILPMKTFINFFMFFTVVSIYGRNIYVSKTGNDSNSGELNTPYLTITKAASEAMPGDIIYIRAGTYEETLTPTRSGTAGSPIIFQSYPGEKVVISAMESLSGWTQDNGAIYKTIVPFTSLGQENFVMYNDTALDLARWPNNEDGLPFTLNSKRNKGGSTKTVINNAYLLSDEIPTIDWTGGALFFYGDKGGSGWLAWKERITSSSSGRVNFNWDKAHDWIRNFHSPADLGDFYLEGVKGALDYQNEWWYNEATQELFVQIPKGVKPVDGDVKMRRRNIAINLNGKSYIQIKNLAVFGGAIEITGNANHNELFQVSSFYGNHTQGIFRDFKSGKASIKVSGSNNSIEKCEIGSSATSGIEFGGNFNQLINNYIHDFNTLGSYDAPLVARGGTDNKILNNRIERGGRDIINYNGQRNEIAYNDISRSNLIADDCALFYTTGSQPNTELHHNWFHDATSRGSKFKAAGIYLDNDGSDFSVHHNVVWNTEWTGIQMNWDASNNNIFNNTFWNNNEVMGAWHKAGTSFQNINVWNNLANDDNWEPQANKENNLAMLTGNPFIDSMNGNFQLKSGSAPVDYGKDIPGITDGAVGAPDAGAYELGDNWVAGINWDPKDSPTGNGCYGLLGEACSCVSIKWYEDADQDGLGNPNIFVEACSQPLGYVVDNTDNCDDDPANRCDIIHQTETIIEAEAYNKQQGIQVESINNGANSNLGFIENSDFTTYNIEIPTAGEYTVTYRVSSASNGGIINLTTDSDITVSYDTGITNTGGWSSWTEVITTIQLPEGIQEIKLTYIGNNGFLFNLDWFKVESSSVLGVIDESLTALKIFPNPVTKTLSIKGLKTQEVFEILNFQGKKIKEVELKNQENEIDVSTFSNGIYLLKSKSGNTAYKFIKN